mmetsp:Transcript_124580/g.248563  ORF Transcript_124580/g.248563 Transcript_124580/m.248563 type:complete len:364 (+) Transcript_124580:32-1123(+)
MELLGGLIRLLEDERTPLLQGFDESFAPGLSAPGPSTPSFPSASVDDDERFSGFQAGQARRGGGYSPVPSFEFNPPGSEPDLASPMWYDASGDSIIVGGLLRCTNCCIAVPEDRWTTVERFGKFEAVLESGLYFAGIDLLGCCVQFRSISKRVQQQMCTASSITKDKLSVTVHIAVQRSVAPENVGQAVYTVTDMGKQVESAVADIIRSLIPRYTLEEFFALSEELSQSIKVPLVDQLAQYGLHVHRINVTDIKPTSDIMDAMNQVKVQSNMYEKSILEAEAAKITTVRQAEAACASLALQGSGTARLRGAIVNGLRGGLGELSQSHAVELLLMSEYCEMLKDLARKGDGHTHAIFLKNSEAT